MRLKTTIKSPKFPWVEWYSDYHGIERDLDKLRDSFKTKRIKAREIGFDGFYWGIFYLDKLPKTKDIKKMLVNTDFDFDREDSDFYL